MFKILFFKSREEEPALPENKIYYQATIIVMNIQINGPEQSPEILKKCGKLVHANMAIPTSREKMINFISLTDLADILL